MSDNLWTMIGRGLAQASADECVDSPPLLGHGRFRSLVADVGGLTVVVVTVVVPKDVAVCPEQVAGATAEAVRQAMAGGKGGA